jgi:protein TonB
LSLRRFFAYSIAVHTLIIIAVIFSMPAIKEKRMGEEFFTRLVSPDEFFTQIPLIPAKAGPRSVPHALSKPVTPAPIAEGNKKLLAEKGGVEKGLSTSHLLSPPTYPGQGIEERPESKGAVQKPEKLGPPNREKLFDRSIIGDLAKREVEKEEKAKKDNTFTFDTKGYKFLIYNKKLKERIESIWIYPPDAAARGIYGELVIKFTIKKNGRLGAVELIRTSGHKKLDDAAIKALRDGEPYWPLPDEWGMEAYAIEGHFLYTIYGYYIR